MQFIGLDLPIQMHPLEFLEKNISKARIINRIHRLRSPYLNDFAKISTTFEFEDFNSKK